MLVLDGKLPTTNEQWSSAKSLLKFSEETFNIQSITIENRSPYYNLFFQGATIFPRNFWFVSIESHPPFGFDPQLPYVISAKDNDTKLPWKNIRLEGNVEAQCLYATIIGRDLILFGFKQLRLIVMPLLLAGEEEHGRKKLYLMQSHEDADRNHMPNLANYLKEAERIWKENARKDEDGVLRIKSPYIPLDYPQRNLTRQNPVGKHKVLYVSAATNLSSCVISLSDELTVNINKSKVSLKAFIAESKTYFFETDNEMEAYYLCAILNSKLVDDWIKPLQKTGEWGEIYTKDHYYFQFQDLIQKIKSI
jgi:hypothetical protein